MQLSVILEGLLLRHHRVIFVCQLRPERDRVVSERLQELLRDDATCIIELFPKILLEVLFELRRISLSFAGNRLRNFFDFIRYSELFAFLDGKRFDFLKQNCKDFAVFVRDRVLVVHKFYVSFAVEGSQVIHELESVLRG